MGGGKRPIVRIKLECTGLVDTVRARQVETRFADKVANGEKVLLFWKRKGENKPKLGDDEVLSRLKNKQPLRSHTGIAEEFEGILRQQMERISTTVLPKELMMDVVTYLGKTDNVNASDIIKKKC
jgi:hypothetical protein